jgi:hypothetical protein
MCGGTESGTMALLDWIFVVFGVAVAIAGSWIELHPERIVPGHDIPGQSGDAANFLEAQLDRRAFTQIRLLGASFLFMGVFFAFQMTVDLVGLPWWTGTISGFVIALLAVTLVGTRAKRKHRSHRYFVHQASPPKKVLELR